MPVEFDSLAFFQHVPCFLLITTPFLVLFHLPGRAFPPPHSFPLQIPLPPSPTRHALFPPSTLFYIKCVYLIVALPRLVPSASVVCVCVTSPYLGGGIPVAGQMPDSCWHPRASRRAQNENPGSQILCVPRALLSIPATLAC